MGEPSPGGGVLRVLSRADVAEVDLSLEEVLRSVEGAYAALAAGQSDNPRKLTVKSPDGASVAYSMLARDGARDLVAFKTSYRRDPDHDRASQHYYTCLLLYDDRTGLPLALMDCGRVGSLRTPAVSALLARHCSRPASRRALLIGTGTQGRLALPFLLLALPDLEDLMLFGTHVEGIRAVQDELRRHHPDRQVRVVQDLEAACADVDIVLAVAGPATPARVEASWLKPGTLTVLVGYGLAPSTLRDADYVVTTSVEQMAVTGKDMADADGVLRTADVELAAVLAGRAPGRRADDDRVFAYNSGLVVTDIAVGHQIARQAAAEGRGNLVRLW